MDNGSSSKHLYQNVPKLRFPDFEGEWKETFLSELLEFQNGINAESEKYGKGIKYISVMDILNNDYITYSNIRGLVDIDDATLQRYSVKYGDILFQRSSETIEDVGNTNVYLDRERTATFGGFVIRGKKISDYDPFFLKCLLCCPSSRKKLVRMGAGSQHYNIGQENLSKIQIKLPDLSEQQKISHLMMLLNKRIAKQRELIDIVKTYKRGALSVMFPQKGETVPRCRFASFTGDWERQKLGDCAEFNPKSDLPDNFEYVDLESVVGTDIISHRIESKSSAPSRAQRLAQKGDVFYQTVRPYQKNNCIFEKDEKNWVFSTGYAQLRPYNDGYFLLTLLQNDDFVKLVLDRCTGTSYPAINSNDLADIDVSIPSKCKEQQQIGLFFKSLDTLITLHQNKLDMLIKTKQSLLQQLFI